MDSVQVPLQVVLSSEHFGRRALITWKLEFLFTMLGDLMALEIPPAGAAV